MIACRCSLGAVAVGVLSRIAPAGPRCETQWSRCLALTPRRSLIGRTQVTSMESITRLVTAFFLLALTAGPGCSRTHSAGAEPSASVGGAFGDATGGRKGTTEDASGGGERTSDSAAERANGGLAPLGGQTSASSGTTGQGEPWLMVLAPPRLGVQERPVQSCLASIPRSRRSAMTASASFPRGASPWALRETRCTPPPPTMCRLRSI